MNKYGLEQIDFINSTDQIQVEKVGCFTGSVEEVHEFIKELIRTEDRSAKISIDNSRDRLVNCNIVGSEACFTIKFFQTPNNLPNFFTSSSECHYDVLLIYSDNQVKPFYVNNLKNQLVKALNVFNKKEIKQINALNPLLAHLTKQYLLDNICLEEVVIVIREHLLLEKLNLVLSLFKLGLKPSNCFFVAKDDKTLFVNRVASYLTEQGVRVIKSQKITEDIIEEISQRYTKKKIIVLDDGGDMISSLARIAEEFKMQLFPIETTSKGISLIQSKFPQLRVIDLANSSIKVNQSRNIAISSVIRIRDILRHKKLSDEYCHVIGYGKIGRWMASLLREIGLKVTISEVSEKLRNKAKEEGFSVFSSAKDAFANQKHKLIVGCSGARTISEREVLYLGNESYFVTVSSQDFKGLIEYLNKNAKFDSLEGIGDLYQISGKKIFMIAHGHAVNLHLSEGVSEPEYDDFTSLMFKTVIEVGRSVSSNSPIDVALFDVEDQCKLIQSIQKELSEEEKTDA